MLEEMLNFEKVIANNLKKILIHLKKQEYIYTSTLA